VTERNGSGGEDRYGATDAQALNIALSHVCASGGVGAEG